MAKIQQILISSIKNFINWNFYSYVHGFDYTLYLSAYASFLWYDVRENEYKMNTHSPEKCVTGDLFLFSFIQLVTDADVHP